MRTQGQIRIGDLSRRDFEHDPLLARSWDIVEQQKSEKLAAGKLSGGDTEEIRAARETLTKGQ